MLSSPSNRTRKREGAALLIALWVILVLSLLVGSFAFDMHIESRITGYYRQRMKAGFASRGGVELAKLMVAESGKGAVSAETDIEDLLGLEKEIAIADERLEKGASVVVKQAIGANMVELEIIPAESRWNVNMLTEEQWEVLLETTGVPQEDWDELLDAFYDWTDENDLVRLNGAESDEEFSAS